MAILILLAVSIWLIRYGIKREHRYKAAKVVAPVPVVAPVYLPPVIAPVPAPKERSEELSTLELQLWRTYHVMLIDALFRELELKGVDNLSEIRSVFNEQKTLDYYSGHAEFMHKITLHPEMYETAPNTV